jgi:hypothetical protein
VGECNYYLKARFPDADTACAAVPALAELLGEGEQAYHFWQDKRTCEDPPRCEPLPIADEFWEEFRRRFPIVCRYLCEVDGVEDWDDGLVGILGCLVDPRDERRWFPSASIVCRNAVLFLRLNGIWHFSDLRLLERYCTAELGAQAAGSISEEELELDDEDSELDSEDFDPFTAIDV